mmetsp:Transcript_18783/g.21201  ORF Transcript_18783/g.21201 Transcript_18783/m.21201 type:complete len:114 (-) Transcript_18783:19-360(-)
MADNLFFRIQAGKISVGSTLTELARTDWDGINEIRPGNYVFNDATVLAKGLIQPDQIALTVLSTVVSVNSAYAIIDAGSKVLSSGKLFYRGIVNSLLITKMLQIWELMELCPP